MAGWAIRSGLTISSLSIDGGLMIRLTLRHIVLTLALSACTLSAAGQIVDSVYLARVQDSVDRYYRLHPRRHPSRPDPSFRTVPVFGLMYAQETGLVAVGGFSAAYRTAADTLAPLSAIGAAAMLSTNLSAAGAVTGKWVLPSGRMVLEYSAAYIYGPRYFWGLGYGMGSDDGNRVSMVSSRVKARADLIYLANNSIQAGVFATYTYYKVSELEDRTLIEGGPGMTQYAGVGARFDLDTRDSRSEPSRGVFLSVQQSVHFSLTGLRPFSRSEVTADFYCPLWSGGVLASDVYAVIHSDAAPWTVWPEAGGDVRLRGYYRGRYRDRNLLSVQVELRQKVYGPHGLAVWGGAGNVFPSFKGFEIKNTLPTYGAGYRCSFLGLVLRLDAGFGLRGQWAVTAGVSHSF